MLSHGGLRGSTFDTSLFAAAIELEGIVREKFPVSDGREFSNAGLKHLNKLIENTCLIQNTKIFKSNIFMIHNVLPKFTKILSHENWSHTVLNTMQMAR